MTFHLWRASLIVVLSVALAADARAESLQTAGDQIVAGIVVVSVGAGVLVTFLILHHKHKKSAITGCVHPAANGLNITDEKDKRTYALLGDPVGIQPGNRMTLEGKRQQSRQGTVFRARAVTKDFGACPP
jgi:hypothetical protein